MKIQTIFIFLVLFAFNVLFANCIDSPFQKSELPAEMPENVRMVFTEHGGMAPVWLRIEVTSGQIAVEEKKINERNPDKWYATISDEDLATLYQSFVTNKFDLIENDAQKDIVYDAGSEGLRIRANKVSKSISYGMNSPLSGKNLTRYSAVSGAIKKLADDYKSEAKSVRSNFVIIGYLQGKHKYIFREGTRAEISNQEIELAENLLGKAITEFNEKHSVSQKINDLDKYKHQIVGVSKANGDKEIWINSLCVTEDQWQKKLIMFEDGGKCYFNLYINLTKRTYRDLYINGVA